MKMRVGSLFSGAGGLDLGFIKAGHEILWAIDNDHDSCLTYSKNIGSHVLCQDVRQVDFAKFRDVDIIIGGFPCQGFSQANMRRSMDDDRNFLYHAFINSVKTKKPRFFVAENVRGILSLGGGAAIQKITSDFGELGYFIEYRTFNAADFGVPQNRVRVFIVGRRDDQAGTFHWPTPKIEKISERVSIGTALMGIPEPDAPGELKNHIGSAYKVTNRNFTGHRRTDPSKPSPTILARGNGKGGVCAIMHPGNHRRMTVREQAILQTFPIDFEFFGSMSSMYRQVGNAVPVVLATHIARGFRGE